MVEKLIKNNPFYLLVIFFYIILFNNQTIKAQELVSPTVLCSSGDDLKNSKIQITWTLGEIAIETFFSENVSFTQGFLQESYSFEKQNSIGETDFFNKIKIFPNPFIQYFNVYIEKKNLNDEISIEILSLEGKKLLIQRLNAENNIVYVPQFPSQIVLLKIICNDKTVSTYKLKKE
jgi:hypothetical protein